MKKLFYVVLALAMASLLFAGTKMVQTHSYTGRHTLPATTLMPVAKMAPSVARTALSAPESTLPAVGTRPHANSLDEVIISENFDAVAEGELPAGWTQVDVDGGTCTQFDGPSVWQVFNYGANAHSGTNVAYNFYNTSGTPITPNNDWLILPVQNLTGAISFSYWIASQDPLYLESYEIRVSTTGTLPANFSNLVYTEAAVPTAWTQHTHDLSAYAGAPFYIAVHYNATDKFVLKLDDVLLTGTPGPRGGIEGIVTAEVGGAPVVGATVSVVGTPATATTDAAGHYVVGLINVGTYSVAVTAAGFMPVTVPNNTVIVDDTITVNVALPAGLFNFITEGFETTAEGSLPLGWSYVDVDGGNSPDMGGPSIWTVAAIASHGGAKSAISAYNDDVPVIANDDWLILPRQSLTGTIALSYWIASTDPEFLDSYEVRVSTTGRMPADFTNLIYDGNDIPTTFTQHTHDLSAYAGSPFYIAFRYNASDKYLIRLDDVTLDASGMGSTGAAIVGTVTGPGDEPLAGVRVQVLTTEMDTVSAANGYYGFNFVDPATYTVMFTHPLYDTLVVTDVVVTAEDTTTVNAAMEVRDGIYISSGTADILDNTEATLSIDITDEMEIGDLDVMVSLTHTFDGDLSLWLESPLGEIVMLSNRLGGGGDNFDGTTFDDEASMSITAVAAMPPYAGRYRPQSPLSAFDGLDLQGTWTLHVSDSAGGDEGVLESFVMIPSPASAADEPVLVPNTFAFHGNYPNPFNAQTTFQFSLAQQGNVALVLYNVAGQEVTRVIDNAPMTAGMHTVSFDAAKFASGVYFARLTAGSHMATHKIALLK